LPPTENGAGAEADAVAEVDAEAGAEAGNVCPAAPAGANRTIPADTTIANTQHFDIFDSTICEAYSAKKGAVWILSAEIGRKLFIRVIVPRTQLLNPATCRSPACDQ
jgi:hypothetical protein